MGDETITVSIEDESELESFVDDLDGGSYTIEIEVEPDENDHPDPNRPQTPTEALEWFADEHPSVVGYSTGDYKPYDYLRVVLDGISPGESAIGNGRAEAEQQLEEWGYDINIAMFEDCTRGGHRDYDFLLGVEVTETD